jgi:phage tail tube protein FII
MSDSNVYTMESANLLCGDLGTSSAPGISTHLVLQELKLPGLEENFVDHTPAGAPIGIEVPTHMNKLECTFNLAGWTPKIMGFIGQNARNYQRFTAYGLIRDRRTSEALQATAVLEGRVGRVNPTAFRKGDLMAHEYSIRNITHYELYMQLQPDTEPLEIYFWDFFTSTRRIDGIDLNDDMIALLAIPANAVDTAQGGGIDPTGGGQVV